MLWVVAGMAHTAAAQCPAGAFGSCLVAHPTPGCAETACCTLVCGTDPSCCTIAWDTPCADAANLVCSLCGATGTGGCFVPHASPACNDATCCAAVCTADPFCCQENWDATCVLGASNLCSGGSGTCGDAGAGSCTVAHPTPACSDGPCCEAVCGADPTCCTNSWDTFCVAAAQVICTTNCAPLCPGISDSEPEPCGDSTNAPCVNGQPGGGIATLASGRPLCGRIAPLASGADTDAYRISVPDPDGNGLARLRVVLDAAGPAFAAVLPTPCTPLSGAAFHLSVGGCISATASQCLPPGTWYVVVARGTFPNPASAPGDCGQFGIRYTLEATALDTCAGSCGGSEPCFAPHDSPGCSDVACCTAVCALDPLCCDKAWDAICVARANASCSPPAAPPNDTCASAAPISALGSIPFTTIGAAPTDLAPPAGCLAAGTASLGRDIWFSISGVEGTVELATCGAGGFDTALVVYRGRCPGTPVACDDDDPLCPSNALSSTVAFTAVCDETYLVRVAGVGLALGNGSLSVRALGTACPECIADIDGNDAVDGVDLSALLAAWATPAADLNGDGTVDGLDLAVMLAGWGPCAP